MLYLLRHGQTEFNTVGRYQGWSDSPLTDLGRDQARANAALLATHLAAHMAAHMDVARPQIWTSPLPRALATADILARALPDAVLTPDPRLRELSLGVWDGMTRAEIAVGWPGVRKAHPPRQWMFHAPQGEGLGPILARLRDVLREATLAAQSGPVILVSHGISGRLLRGLHAGLTPDDGPALHDALHLDAAQDVVHLLLPEGRSAVLTP